MILEFWDTSIQILRQTPNMNFFAGTDPMFWTSIYWNFEFLVMVFIGVFSKEFSFSLDE